PPGPPGHVGTAPSDGQPGGIVVVGAAKLPGPERVPERADTHDEGVGPPAPALAGKGSAGAPGHEAVAGGVEDDGLGVVGTLGSELAGPQVAATGAEGGDVGVALTGRLLTGKRTLRRPDDQDVAAPG